jgi:hypothetical protein
MKLSSWLALSFAATAGVAQPRVAADNAHCDRAQSALKAEAPSHRAKAVHTGIVPRIHIGRDPSRTTARDVFDMLTAFNRGDVTQWNLARLQGP